MKVSILQVDRCKPILGLGAFDNAPARQHLKRELVPGELNQVAESTCALEPARRAGQCEPRLQTPCKRVRGEVLRPRTALSWLLARWVVGKSEEAGCRTLSSHGPENPEAKLTGLDVDSAWGGAAQEGTHGDGQTEAWSRGQQWSVHHAGAGCAGSPGSAAVPLRTAGQSPRRCHRTAPPGRWGRRGSVLCRCPSSLPD